MGIKKRLEDLVENPHLKANMRDYNFAVSLQQAYLKQGRLTPGRRPWLDKLEEKYSADAVEARSVNVDTPLATRLENLLQKTPERSWDRGFVESVLNQTNNSYSLSARQLEVIERIEGEYSDGALAERQKWSERYLNPESGLRQDAVVVSKYYFQNTPYFTDLSRMVLHDEEFVPTEAQFNKMVKNKYAQKIVTGARSEPKYPTGTLVQLRATSPRYKNKKAMVMVTDYISPISPCAGNKVYQLLPLGETTPFVVEERFIKTWRAAK